MGEKTNYTSECEKQKRKAESNFSNLKIRSFHNQLEIQKINLPLYEDNIFPLTTTNLYIRTANVIPDQFR